MPEKTKIGILRLNGSVSPELTERKSGIFQQVFPEFLTSRLLICIK
jgi:hypothetical protein